MDKILISVGDQLTYSVGDADYCLTVVNVQPEFCLVRHAEPYEHVQFKFYYRRGTSGAGAAQQLLKSIRDGHFVHVTTVGDPDWEM